MNTYITVDPGLKNTAICLVQVWGEGQLLTPRCKLLYNKVFDLSSKRMNPDERRARVAFPQAAHEIATICGSKDIVINKVLIEFQPPIAFHTRAGLIRWNCWVEGYAFSFFSHCPILPNVPVEHVHPSSVKRHFDCASGQHSVNKSLAIRCARGFLAGAADITDHEADCVLMAVFQFQKE